MNRGRPLDQVDREILELLRLNARRTVKDISQRVGLSAAPVKRRIERLEADGVIARYTIEVDESLAGDSLEAFTELRYSGGVDQEEIMNVLSRIAEVKHVYITAGNTDALVHLRVDKVSDLKHVIGKLRSGGNPLSSRTLIVFENRPGGGSQPST